ncbi:uncharcterized protein [Sporisorium scitamineum]|uniref:Uncharcterized protein n=1 Tax=Sporisorium scitamineum TaxID=49012 RepID=A0A127Z5B5_9BASI|nr:uncharcterized protein [Sporisorium scitamineum]
MLIKSLLLCVLTAALASSSVGAVRFPDNAMLWKACSLVSENEETFINALKAVYNDARKAASTGDTRGAEQVITPVLPEGVAAFREHLQAHGRYRKCSSFVP